MKLIKTYVGRINKEDCDLYGHMNTLKYIDKFYAAADVFLPKIGLGDAVLFKIDLGVAYLEFNHRYLKECFEGEEIEIFGEIVERNAKVMSLKQIMKYPDQDIILAESLLKFLVFDLKSRKSIRLDDDKLSNIINLELLN
ncbi:MAG: thioesterase family protein [Bacteroidia bacterium]|nr:thioesterase family protein [Bacteroidia bacterium]